MTVPVGVNPDDEDTEAVSYAAAPMTSAHFHAVLVAASFTFVETLTGGTTTTSTSEHPASDARSSASPEYVASQ